MAHVVVNVAPVVLEPQPFDGIDHTVWMGPVEDEPVLATIRFARPVGDHGHGGVVQPTLKSSSERGAGGEADEMMRIESPAARCGSPTQRQVADDKINKLLHGGLLRPARQTRRHCRPRCRRT